LFQPHNVTDYVRNRLGLLMTLFASGGNSPLLLDDTESLAYQAAWPTGLHAAQTSICMALTTDGNASRKSQGD
jgi:hypothetical protein